MSPAIALPLAAFLVVGNGFFVGVEFALLASRRSLLVHQAETSRRARRALSAVDRLPLMVAACQFGITLCSLGLGAVGEPAVSALVEPVLELARLPHDVLHPVSFAIALMIVAVLHMLIGEMVPKNIALAGPEPSALLLTPALLAFLRVFRPVVAGLTWAATAVLRLLGVTAVDEHAGGHSPEQVAALVAEARREGLLGGRQHTRLDSALKLGQRTATQVLLSSRHVVAVAEGASPQDVEALVARTGYSRFPVQNDRGEYTGYLHVADILGAPGRSRTKPLPSSLLRPLATAHQDAVLQDVLSALQRSGAHLGQVVDGAGEPLGVIFLEDVLEELVGEVRDLTRHRAG